VNRVVSIYTGEVPAKVSLRCTNGGKAFTYAGNLSFRQLKLHDFQKDFILLRERIQADMQEATIEDNQVQIGFISDYR
jgi:hypothetical protein